MNSPPEKAAAPTLKIDWCSHEAAKVAVEHWHYSGVMPTGKSNRIGAWEDGVFVGAIIFAQGGNMHIGKPFGLTSDECCELVRVALRAHVTPVSRMLAIATRFLKRRNPGLRLVVSYADPSEGHHGGIYQACGWLYLGLSRPTYEFRLNGARLQKRSFTGVNFGRERMALPAGAVKIEVPGKHKYVLPLDEAMRVSLEPQRVQYPKQHARAVVDSPKVPPLDGRSTRPARSKSIKKPNRVGEGKGSR